MKKQIRQTLKTIEETRDIRILYACESGSRAWGFASPDSDYDVRFIYCRPVDWYLSILNRRDHIDFPLQGELDFAGWDLNKTLSLALKSNATVFEWMQSPIVYSYDLGFEKDFWSLITGYFDPKRTKDHYLGLSVKSAEQAFSGKVIHLKKCFYALRTLFAAQHIVNYSTMPPIEFNRLLPLVDDKNIRLTIDVLLDEKSKRNEKGTIPEVGNIRDYFYDTYQKLRDHPTRKNYKGKSTNLLDEFFRKIIRNDH